MNNNLLVTLLSSVISLICLVKSSPNRETVNSTFWAHMNVVPRSTVNTNGGTEN